MTLLPIFWHQILRLFTLRFELLLIGDFERLGPIFEELFIFIVLFLVEFVDRDYPFKNYGRFGGLFLASLDLLHSAGHFVEVGRDVSKVGQTFLVQLQKAVVRWKAHAWDFEDASDHLLASQQLFGGLLLVLPIHRIELFLLGPDLNTAAQIVIFLIEKELLIKGI